MLGAKALTMIPTDCYVLRSFRCRFGLTPTYEQAHVCRPFDPGIIKLLRSNRIWPLWYRLASRLCTLTSKLASEFCLFDPGIIIKLGIVAQIFKYVPGCIWKGMQSGIFYAKKDLEIFLKNCYKIHKSLFGITEIPEENPSVEECWNLLTNGRTSAIIPVMQKTPASKYNFWLL